MKHVGAVCAALIFFSAVSAKGQDAAAAKEDADASGFSAELSITVPTSYMFRGYVEEEDQFLVQPEFFITYTTTVGGFSVAPYIGAWANFSDAPAPGDPECFDELDLYIGTDIELGHGLTLGAIYTYYMSPADTFDDIHEVGITLSHEDLLNPSIGIYRELCNKNGDENTYIELGLTPGCDVPKVEKLHVDFPLLLGLSPDEYYTDSDGDGTWIGYASAGVHATYSFNDNIALIAGVEYWHLCADSTQESNDGDQHQFVGFVGVKFLQ